MEWNLIRACRCILLSLKTNELTENRIIYQENLTLLDLPENSLLMIPVSIMTKIPMKRTDDPIIHMKQILRPFSSSQVKKDWICKHKSWNTIVPLIGIGKLWQSCKLGLWLYQLWSFSNISFLYNFLQKKWHFERKILERRKKACSFKWPFFTETVKVGSGKNQDFWKIETKKN